MKNTYLTLLNLVSEAYTSMVSNDVGREAYEEARNALFSMIKANALIGETSCLNDFVMDMVDSASNFEEIENDITNWHKWCMDHGFGRLADILEDALN